MVMEKFSLVMETLDMVMEMAGTPPSAGFNQRDFAVTTTFLSSKNGLFADVYETFIKIITISY